MATAKELSDNLRDMFLQCKVCLDNFKQPKTLPCLHTFCSDCIAYYIDHNRINSRKFACPICRRHIYIPQNGVDDFPDSFFVHNLSDVVAQQANRQPVDEPPTDNCGICKFKEETSVPSMVCIDCKINLCSSCAENHRTAKVTESHTLLPYEQGSSNRENYCRVHRGETIKYYCETCNTCICLPCTFLEHQNHEIEDIKVVRQGIIQDLSSMVLQSEDNMLQLNQAKNDMHDLENELFARKEIVKSEVRRSAQDLIRSVQEQEQKLMLAVDEFYDTPSIRRDIQRLERTIYRLDRAHHFAQQLLAPDTSPVAQIVNKAEAKENLKTALTYELPDMMHHGTKLVQYAHYLPGSATVNLGALLHCNGPTQSHAVVQCRPFVPSVTATFMCKIKLNGDRNEASGDVLSMAFLPNCDLVVLMLTEGKKVKIFNRRGKLAREFGDDLNQPSDMIITHDGSIAVTELESKSIKIYDQLGIPVNVVAGVEASVFDAPMAVAVDALGGYLVCDQEKQSLMVVTQTGTVQAVHKIPEVQQPQYICYYDNKIYICDENAICVYSYTRDELVFLAKLSTPDTDSGVFLDCSGICVSKHGDLLVTDTLQDRIYMFNGMAEAGVIKVSGHQLLKPSTIAISPDGVMAVSAQGITLDPNQRTPTKHIALYRLARSEV